MIFYPLNSNQLMIDYKYRFIKALYKVINSLIYTYIILKQPRIDLVIPEHTRIFLLVGLRDEEVVDFPNDQHKSRA